MITNLLAYFKMVSSTALSVWFISWALRKRYDLECKLTNLEQAARGVLILAGFSLGLVPGENLWAIRVCGGIGALCFVALPELAKSLVEHFPGRSKNAAAE